MKVKCNKCGHIGELSEFPQGRDFCQIPYVKACPKCDNRQSPGDASMRMFGGKRPFVIVRDKEPDDPLDATIYRSKEVS